MSDITETLFGPISKEYCIWFYFLSVIGFIGLLFVLISSLFVGISKKKGLDFYLHALALVAHSGVIYFQNRLLYSMCVAK
jgi:hypothetical protein